VILDPPKPAISRSVHAARLAFVTVICAIGALGVALLMR
jgi:hypothetical protein